MLICCSVGQVANPLSVFVLASGGILLEMWLLSQQNRIFVKNSYMLLFFIVLMNACLMSWLFSQVGWCMLLKENEAVVKVKIASHVIINAVWHPCFPRSPDFLSPYAYRHTFHIWAGHLRDVFISWFIFLDEKDSKLSACSFSLLDW